MNDPVYKEWNKLINFNSLINAWEIYFRILFVLKQGEFILLFRVLVHVLAERERLKQEEWRKNIEFDLKHKERNARVGVVAEWEQKSLRRNGVIEKVARFFIFHVAATGAY